MNRTQLALASAATAAAACVAVTIALRGEPPGEPAHSAAPAAEAAAALAPVASASPAQNEASPDRARILAENALAADAAEEALRNALLAAARDESLPLAAKLDRYRAAVATGRESMPAAPIWGYPGMLVELFVREDAVQRDLASLAPAARAGELAEIRRALGFDDEGIARAAALDERREARWQKGLGYMEERARLAASFEGEALEAELRALREEVFAHEAVTIEREEREGFFRFERPRIYGRN
jgi:hypothetical protein